MGAILIVDDEESIRALLKELLRGLLVAPEVKEWADLGITRLLTASEGAEALALMEQEEIALAIVDINLPRLDGMQVLARIKERSPETEVIVITGYASLETAIEAVRRGAYDYITKPFDHARLLKVAAHALDRWRLQKENKRLFQTLEKRVAELHLLYELTASLNRVLEPRRVLMVVAEVLPKAIAYDVLSLLLVERQAELTMIPRHVVSEVFLERVKQQALESARQILPTLSEVSVALHVLEPEVPPSQILVAEEPRASLTIPLEEGEAIVGVLHLSRAQAEAFTSDEEAFVRIVAQQLLIALNRLRETAAAEQDKISAMLESMSEGVVMVDEARQVRVINRAAKEVLGLTGDATTEAFVNRCEELGLCNLLQNGGQEKQSAEYRLETPTPRVLKVNVSRVRSHTGELWGTVFTFHDVTREKELDEMRQDLLSQISHDLRTPLSLIKNALGIVLAQKAGALTPEQLRFLSIANKNADKLAHLLDTILDLDRIRRGKLELEIELMDVERVIDAALATFQPIAEQKRITLQKQLTEGLPKVYADAGRLEQILNNLLQNAIKFTAEGGRVWIRAMPYTDPADPETAWVRIDVQDTGIGIPAEARERIFEGYYRAPTTKEQGLGLGLAITKALVEAHKGRIWVESTVGEGSCFSFLLPAERRRPRKPVVLIVEDEPDMVETLSFHLQSEGFACEVAYTGMEALRKANELAPDAILLDIMLPDINGYQVCRRLKAEERTRHIPILMLTARSQASDRFWGLEAGAEAYIVKPFEIEEVTAKLREVLKL
ncbi:MAG: response regulator [Blastocatellia bacterium]|nr:response regulator [Blastocatellia bacterium]MCS7157370.1 response regulator [Blastocatellia bacterium]MCX7753236.1 response regulator [Blastocatellia bacterium]MDW8168275.1 response regulator [Acidobacteriota bacterium]MDW8255432.1 response regulator [Acidobacteriota bacterium]